MKRIINDLITNKNKNIGPITNSDDLIIINLPKNPRKGGSPPRDRRKKTFTILLRWLELSICAEILLTGDKNMK